MTEWADRERVMRKIERVCANFQQLTKSGLRPTFFLPEEEAVDADFLELQNRNPHRFLLVMRVLVNIYVSVKTNTYRTKRDLYYESKQLFGTQAVLDEIVNFITRLLQECRFNLHILATSKGLVIGDLSFKVPPSDEEFGGAMEINCRDGVAQIPMLPMEITDVKSKASFILVAEKDATFQCFVDENAHVKLGAGIIITAKGYPDYATRVFLYRLHSELELPVYGLMDADPHGVDIYMIYKYGSTQGNLHDVFDIGLPSMIWLGVYPTEAIRLPIDAISKLPLSDLEKEKAAQLMKRTDTLDEVFVSRELKYLIDSGFKIEMEAVSALGNCFLTEQYLKIKLAAIAAAAEE